MGVQNLRNKYSLHPIIHPLITYCEDNGLSFEFVKDSTIIEGGKSFRPVNRYYMIIGGCLLNTRENLHFWDNLLLMILNAYEYLGLPYPESLIKAAKIFGKMS